MKNYLLILFLCFSFNATKAIESKIIYNIGNEIITNIDIKKEFKYLIALNSSLKELDKKKILNISNESIIREKIKKIELSKNFKELKLNKDYYRDSDIIPKEELFFSITIVPFYTFSPDKMILNKDRTD
jgi:hypothetical protein